VRVLGVDPGLTRCGVGVVQSGSRGTLDLVAVEVVRTEVTSALPERLVLLSDRIGELVIRHRPDVVAVERVFSQHNVRTVMGTAQAGAVAVLAAGRAGVPVAWHTPSEVKAAVTGVGTAPKEQVGAMVRRLLRLEVAPTPADAADALALAICQIWRGAAQRRIEAALAAAGGPSAAAPVPPVGGTSAAQGPPVGGTSAGAWRPR